MSRHLTPLVAVLVLATSSCREAPRTAGDGAADDIPADTALAVRSFVQEFYDWYVIHDTATGEQDWRGIRSAITTREAAFDSALVDALEEDERAQREDATGNIVGLEFDPFLNSQDICGRYVAGTVRRDASGFLVNVFAECDGRRDSLPNLVAAVAAPNGAWVFTNFRYTGEPATDLRKVLADLRGDRTP